MPCTPNCGFCCDPVFLDAEMVTKVYDPARTGPQGQWLTDNWEPIGPANSDGVLFRCASYDVEHRTCLTWETRPEVCRGFPFYGRPPEEAAVSKICGYQADLGRTVLTIVEVR